MTPFECYFYYFGILLEYRANFRHRNQKISLADTVNWVSVTNKVKYLFILKPKRKGGVG